MCINHYLDIIPSGTEENAPQGNLYPPPCPSNSPHPSPKFPWPVFPCVHLATVSSYTSSPLHVARILSSASTACIHLPHLLPCSGSGQSRNLFSTRLHLTIQGANITSTNPSLSFMKKGPSEAAASTSVLMQDCSFACAGEVGGRGEARSA